MKKYEEQIVMQGEELLGGFYWPSIARLSDGRLICGCSGFRLKHICPFGEVAISFSSDEGKTWSKPESVLNTPLDDRDAGVIEHDGKIIITSFNNTRAFQLYELMMYGTNLPEEQKKMIIDKVLSVSYEDEKKYLGSVMFYSTDNGKTFSDPVKLPVTAPHGMTKLNDGTLFYVGRYFQDALPCKTDHYEGIGIIRSTDGINFTEPVDLPLPEELKNAEGSLFCEPHAIQLKSGRILIGIRVHRKNKPFTVYTCYSDDGGETFTMPKPLLINGKEVSGSPPHFIQHSSGAVVLVYARREFPTGERACVSYDDGETWVGELILNEEPNPNQGDIGYPATVELESGDLYTIYYTHRNPNSTINAVTWSISDMEELK